MAYRTLLLFLLLAGHLCDATDYNILDFAMARKHELWMAEHGRVYMDEVEKAHRFEIFKKNLKYIEDFNIAGEHSYTLGVNQFADLTSEEFAADHTGCEELPETEFEETDRSFEHETLESLNAASLDWRTKGAVTPVKDQGDCNLCWAMSVVAAVESLVQIKKGSLRDLSEQQILDCNKEGVKCNDKSKRTIALKYIIGNKGLTLRSNYPYKAADGKCNKKKEKEVIKNTAIIGYKGVKPANEKALLLAVTQQPVTVAIDFPKGLQFYNAGIFSGPCGTDLNHGLVVVGYGTEGTTKYWIVKNSHGTSWGEKGYLRIKRLDDDKVPHGLCGIAASAAYPTL